MGQIIWSIIATLGGLVVIVGVAYFIATGRHDRDDDEAARRYFDEHGHWPDEAPAP
jgi:ribose/xylose/arabinose/galactoside ABC-type transport system permease subunit